MTHYPIFPIDGNMPHPVAFCDDIDVSTGDPVDASSLAVGQEVQVWLEETPMTAMAKITKLDGALIHFDVDYGTLGVGFAEDDIPDLGELSRRWVESSGTSYRPAADLN